MNFNANFGNGAIALSDFVTYQGSCELNSICDFEGGNCSWASSSKNPSYNFQLVKSSLSEHDHTTESGFGHLMEASNGN